MNPKSVPILARRLTNPAHCRWYACGLLISIFIASICSAATPERPSENIAIGAQYTLDPKPSYEYCTDADDAKQLTDGAYTEGHFWTQQSTVGWTNGQPVCITMDLGAIKPIRGASYNTAAGVAGVEWPTTIYLLVADEDKQFHELGELVALGAKKEAPSKDGYAVHRFWTDEFEAHARYVAFIVWGSPYIFADELEVFAGDPAWLGKPLPGEIVPDMKTFATSLATRVAIKRRLRDDAASVRKDAENSGLSKEVVTPILSMLDAAEKESASLPAVYGHDFRAILPLNDPHAKIFKAKAALWTAKGVPPFTIWRSKTWDPLSHLADPPLNTEPSIRVTMMRNEHRAATFNITNATQEDAFFALRLEGLPSGAEAREVAWTDTTSGVPVAAALVPLELKDGAYQMHVHSGMTRQIWLSFYSKDAGAGEMRGAAVLEKGLESFSIPVTVDVRSIAFPERPTLHFGGWDYTNNEQMYGMTRDNRAALIAAMKEYFVDSPWATMSVMPYGQYDAEGRMTTPPDVSEFDNWINLWSGANCYCVFANVSPKLAAFDMGTPQFESAAKAWIEFWAAHIREKGLAPSQFKMLLVDEPREPEHDAVIFAWTKVLHAANTGVRVWEDPIYHDMSKADLNMTSSCDVLCPNRQVFVAGGTPYQQYYVDRRESGVALEFYSCSGPVRLLDPYTYHRLQAWTCWEFGADATYFWAFGDSGGGSCFNEYPLKGSTYTPFFIDDKIVMPGKHIEACREGIEDYEYFVMLKKAVDAAEQRGVSKHEIEHARALLAEAPKRVNASTKTLPFRWDGEGVDRDEADRIRVEILDELIAISLAK